MRWLALMLAGPMIWAIGFSVVYALHGTGCARGWTDTAVAGSASLHVVALWSGWLITLAAGLLLLLALPPSRTAALAPGGGDSAQLPRIGAWIGLGATLFTLLPVAVASSC